MWGGGGGLLGAYRTLWRCERALSRSCGVFTPGTVAVDWWPWQRSGGGYWINTINITVGRIFVFWVWLFGSVVYLHKPIKEPGVTAHCQISPFIVRWITASVQTGFTVQADTAEQLLQRDNTHTHTAAHDLNMGAAYLMREYKHGEVFEERCTKFFSVKHTTSQQDSILLPPSLCPLLLEGWGHRGRVKGTSGGLGVGLGLSKGEGSREGCWVCVSVWGGGGAAI